MEAWAGLRVAPAVASECGCPRQPPLPAEPPTLGSGAALAVANDIYFLLSASGRDLSFALPADVNSAALLC